MRRDHSPPPARRADLPAAMPSPLAPSPLRGRPRRPPSAHRGSSAEGCRCSGRDLAGFQLAQASSIAALTAPRSSPRAPRGSAAVSRRRRDVGCSSFMYLDVCCVRGVPCVRQCYNTVDGVRRVGGAMVYFDWLMFGLAVACVRRACIVSTDPSGGPQGAAHGCPAGGTTVQLARSGASYREVLEGARARWRPVLCVVLEYVYVCERVRAMDPRRTRSGTFNDYLHQRRGFAVRGDT